MDLLMWLGFRELLKVETRGGKGEVDIVGLHFEEEGSIVQ